MLNLNELPKTGYAMQARSSVFMNEKNSVWWKKLDHLMPVVLKVYYESDKLIIINHL